jgi:signal recognition particle subunit SRP72
MCRPVRGEMAAERDVEMRDSDPPPKKRLRKRKPRMPKGFDPNNPGPPPDPERWLPKHERSAFKKRRKGKAKQQPLSKGAQVQS